MALDSQGNLYVTDPGNMCIRKIDTSGNLTTVAGKRSSLAGISGDGGPAISAQLAAPTDVAIDSARNMYIADYGNLRIRKVNTSGIITPRPAIARRSRTPHPTMRLYPIDRTLASEPD
jgi:hypothetical protein